MNPAKDVRHIKRHDCAYHQCVSAWPQAFECLAETLLQRWCTPHVGSI